MDDGDLSLWMFFYLALENNIASNKIGLEVLLVAFQQALKFGVEPRVQSILDPRYGQQDKDQVEIKSYQLNFEQFKYAISLLAKSKYRGNAKPIDNFLSQLRKGPPTTLRTHKSRRPKIHQKVKQILTSASIKVVNKYLFQLKKIFTTFHFDNQKSGKFQLTWDLIEEENYAINIKCLIRLYRHFRILPHLLTLESIEEIIKSVTPPQSHDQMQYYEHRIILQDYEKFISRTNASCQPSEDKNEPQFLFTQFIMVLMMTGAEIGQGPSISKKIDHFLQHRMRIQPIPNQTNKTNQELENLVMFQQNSYDEQQLQHQGGDIFRDIGSAAGSITLGFFSDSQDGQREEDQLLSRQQNNRSNLGSGLGHNHRGSISSMMSNPEQQKANKQQQLGDNSDDQEFNELTILDIQNQLDKVIPQMYQEQKVKKINPPPYKMPRILYKPGPDGKYKKTTVANTKQSNQDDANGDNDDDDNEGGDGQAEDKRTTKTSRFNKVLEYQVPKKIFTQDTSNNRTHLRNLSQNLTQHNGKKLTGFSSVAPELIEEILFPPTSNNRDIHDIIECGLDFAYSKRDYQKARIKLLEAYTMWKRQQEKLRPEVRIYFHLMIGSMFDLCGYYQKALREYLKAKRIRLPYNHPDSAFPFCSFGVTFYKMNNIEYSVRCFQMARGIREDRLGEDTADTATVYNNLGCCMYSMKRNSQAIAYFNLAEAIMNLQLGAHHQRTLITLHNINLTKKSSVQYEPQYKPLFSFAVTGAKAGGKKKKKGKKKGKKKK